MSLDLIEVLGKVAEMVAVPWQMEGGLLEKDRARTEIAGPVL